MISKSPETWLGGLAWERGSLPCLTNDTAVVVVTGDKAVCERVLVDIHYSEIQATLSPVSTGDRRVII